MLIQIKRENSIKIRFNYYLLVKIRSCFNHLNANPQNGQTHSNNSLVTADELFECAWPFCAVGAQRIKVDGHLAVNFQMAFLFYMSLSTACLFGIRQLSELLAKM